MLQRHTYWLLILVVGLFTSCITNKQSLYLQNNDSLPVYSSVTPTSYKIRQGDQLYIKIESIIEEENSFLGSGGSQTSMSGSMLYLQSYEVYSDGNIDYPYVGKIPVAGKSAREVREQLQVQLKDYLAADAKVTVKLVNSFISVIGEVKRGGRFGLNEDQLTIFDAIAMAGDLSNFGDRRKIKVIRKTDNGSIVKEFDLRTKDLLGSEYYFVQPGDVIYVSKVRGQFFRMDNFGTTLSMVTSSLSFLLLVLNYSK